MKESICPIVPFFPLPSLVKDEVSFELKILLDMYLERLLEFGCMGRQEMDFSNIWSQYALMSVR